MTDTLLKSCSVLKGNMNANKNFKEDDCENSIVNGGNCNISIFTVCEQDKKSEISNGRRIDLDGEDKVLYNQINNKSNINE